MKHLIYVLLIFIFITLSCNKNKVENSNTENSNTENSEMVILDSLKQEEDIVLDTIILPQIYNDEGVSVFLPGLYRMNEPSDFADMLNEEWCELYQDSASGDYYFTRAVLDIDKYDDDCMGLGYKSTYVSSKRSKAELGLSGHSILFVEGLEYNNSPVNSVKLKQGMVWVGSKMPFTLSGKEYILDATGDIIEENTDTYENDKGQLMKYQSVANYKLYLTSEQNGTKKRELLVAIPSFNNTNVEILFIGDLDHDDKPDFVFSTSRDYESARVVLMLSSKAKGGESVRCVGEGGFEFDC